MASAAGSKCGIEEVELKETKSEDQE